MKNAKLKLALASLALGIGVATTGVATAYESGTCDLYKQRCEAGMTYFCDLYDQQCPDDQETI